MSPRKMLDTDFSLIKLNDYVTAMGISTLPLLEGVQAASPKATVFPAVDQAYLASPHDSYNFPPVYVATVSNALVYGRTNLCFAENVAICHDLYDFERDSTEEERHGRHQIDVPQRRLRLLHSDNNPASIRVAAAFVDACAYNYAHWLTEVLPRIAAFCANKQFEGIPIIVDAGLHKNILESLCLITGPAREIITLPASQAIKVALLYITSVAGYVPYERRNDDLSDYSQGKFSTPALELMRQKIIPYAEKPAPHPWPKKIYIRRNSTIRTLSNAAELEQLFSSQGYIVVSPEKFNFLQQVGLFLNAEEIVSATGAALGSAIFCKPGTRIGVLMSKHERMVFRYWLHMLAPLKVDVFYLLGELDAKGRHSMHGDFSVNCNDAFDFLQLRKNK